MSPTFDDARAAGHDVLVLGAGYTGTAVLQLCRALGLSALGVVRNPDKAAVLVSAGVRALAVDPFARELGALASAGTHVVVAFPPDGETDARIATALAHARAITYVSTVGVYGPVRGVVDDSTPVARDDVASERVLSVLRAEAAWREVSATVLRCPGIYGPDRGLHVRVVSGRHRIPGDGTRFLSRIHVEDLASLVLASAKVRAETFVVGDLHPAPHNEIVGWIAAQYGVALPPHVPLEEVHETLRADRRVDPRRALARLEITLAYPTYKEGMAPHAARVPMVAPAPALRS